MENYGVEIRAFGKCLPEKSLTNHALEKVVDTSDEWIFSRTGIKERRISGGEQENTAALCAGAVKDILVKTGLDPLEIDIIIVATMTPDYLTPSTACLVQKEIGAENALAFDLSAACSGFIYALTTAESLLQKGCWRKAVVVGGDVLSKILDWEDRRTCVLFGDGAGAVLLEAKENGENRFLGVDIHADGGKSGFLTAHHFPMKNPFMAAESLSLSPAVAMDGRGIFDFALKRVPKSIEKLLKDANCTMDDIKYIVPHQANYRIVAAVAKKLKLPMERFYMNIDRFGNTTAGTIPIALCEMAEQGLIKPGKGDKLILTGFGGGLTWGSLLVEI